MACLSNEGICLICNGNARGADRLYQERFPNRYLSEHRMITNLHGRQWEHGSFNENRRGFGQPRELLEAEKEVLIYFRDNPHTSIRAAARNFGLRNKVEAWYVLKDNHLHSYHFQKVQYLFSTEYLPREQFCTFVAEARAERWFFVKVCSFYRRSLFHTHRNHRIPERSTHTICTTDNR